MARKRNHREPVNTLDSNSDDPEVLRAIIASLQDDNERLLLSLRSAERRAQRAAKKAAEYDRALTARNTMLINARTIDGAPVPDRPLQLVDCCIDIEGTITDLKTSQGMFVNIDTKIEMDSIIELMGIQSREVYAAIHYDKTKRDLVLRKALNGGDTEPQSRFMTIREMYKAFLFRTYGEIEPVINILGEMMQWVVSHDDACKIALEGNLQPLIDLATSEQLGPFAAENRELLTIKTRGAERREYVLWAGERVGQFVQAGRQFSDIDPEFVAELERAAQSELSQSDYENVRNLTERRYTEGANGMPYVRRRLDKWMQSWEDSRN